MFLVSFTSSDWMYARNAKFPVELGSYTVCTNTMQIFPTAEVITHDSPDELLFIIVRRYGWAIWFGLAILVVLVTMAWVSGRPIWAVIIALLGGGPLVINWARGPVTRLRITSNELIADGNLGGLANVFYISVSDVGRIGWDAGGEDGTCGLYVWKSRWWNHCLIPDISQEQCEVICQQILIKYPHFERDDTPASILHGDGSGLISLGIASTVEESAQS